MKPNDFTELASLYVLGGLDERDNYLIEDYAESSEELKAELMSLQVAALAIPYGSQQCSFPMELKESIKERLFQKINSEHPTETPIVEIDIPESYQVKASKVKWEPHPEGIEGISIAPLFVDRSSRKFSGLVRCEIGAIYPAHRHYADEEIFILEGDLIVDGKSFSVGDYIYSAPNSLHPPIGNNNGCVFFIRTSLDDRFV
jgi:ChrR Cupin-like domain